MKDAILFLLKLAMVDASHQADKDHAFHLIQQLEGLEVPPKEVEVNNG
jgi:hypothetical protein